jgi:hypothetical protein
MALPSDLVTHYSSKALQTRLAALGFVGAVLGAEVVWKDNRFQSDILGIGLLLIVGSLAELNRRYTYSYLCACRASARSESATQMWADFRRMNELLWGWESIPVEKKTAQTRSPRNWVSRFLLSWGTYLPGIAAGLYLVIAKFNETTPSTERTAKLVIAVFIAASLVIWWAVESRRVYNPERIFLVNKGSDSENQTGPGQLTVDKN